MKVEYTCSRCLKDFKQKAQYNRHVDRKNKCEPSKSVSELLEKTPTVVDTLKDSTGSFREISIRMNKSISLKERQKQGIFFTPKEARKLIFQKLQELHVNPSVILEPSCGSGEFLYDLKQHYPNASIIGVEYNEDLFNSLSIEGVTTIHSDFLKYPATTKNDLIVGNPPYFVIEEENPECMVGRPNIYIAFLYTCLKDHLADNGYLAFVLPTSLFNCSYYEPMRKYIAEHCTIHYVEKLDVKYYQTQQDTMMILLQKKHDPQEKYLFKRNGSIYISPSYQVLNSIVKSSTTLHAAGFEVKTGDVVWNQVRDGKDPTKLQKPTKKQEEGKPYPDIGELVDSNGTLVVYDSNIVNGTLVIGNIQDKEKKQYIKGFNKKEREEYTTPDGKVKSRLVPKTPIKEPTILVTRGHGNNYKFNFVLVKGKEFYAENHVNMILAKTEEAKKKVDDVVRSLNDPRTLKFVEEFLGNGAMSATELQNVLPIFIS